MNKNDTDKPKALAKSKKSKRRGRITARQIGLKKTVVLVGLMGAGKTTVGRRLARKLHLNFVDSDHEIEKAADMSVAEIFEVFGEEEFRNGERRVIERLLDGKPKILATGGGAYLNEKTRALIKEAAVTVWLNVDVQLLVERTGLRDTRPLLQTGNREEILTRLANERYPIYSEADVVVKSGKGSHEVVVNDTVAALRKYLGGIDE